MTTALPHVLDTRSRWHRVKGPVLLAGGLLGASVLLHLRDPHRSGSWGACPWLLLTGTYCPGCGGLRAVNDLTDGDVARRRVQQPAVRRLAAVPRVLVEPLAGDPVARRRTGRSSTRRVLGPVLVFSALALVFWVVRNLPVGAWLAP